MSLASLAAVTAAEASGSAAVSATAMDLDSATDSAVVGRACVSDS
jgi:hypothetical protein